MSIPTHLPAPLLQEEGAVGAQPAKSRRINLWFWVITLSFLALTVVPNLLGWLRGPGQWQSFGLQATTDRNIYLSQIEEASQGHLLLRNLFTSEPQGRLWLSPLWGALGWLKLLLRGSGVLWFELARLVAGFGLLWWLWQRLRELLGSVRWADYGLLLGTVAGGFGWVWAITNLGQLSNPEFVYEQVAVDLWQAEFTIWGSISHSALFAGSQLLLGWLIWRQCQHSVSSLQFSVDSEREDHRAQSAEQVSANEKLKMTLLRPASDGATAGEKNEKMCDGVPGRGQWAEIIGRAAVWPAVFGSLLLALAHTYDLIPLVAVVGIWGIWKGWRAAASKRWLNALRVAWQGLWPLLLGGGIGAGYLLYAFWREPALGGWALQNWTPAPPFHSVLLGYGLQLPFIIAAVWLIIKRREQRWHLPLLWWLAQLALAALPWPFGFDQQRRWVSGLALPATLLLVYGVREAVSVLRIRVVRGAALLALAAIIAPTFAMLMIFWLKAGATLSKAPWYYPAPAIALFEKAKELPEDAIILAADRTGNTLPRYSGRRSYFGSGHQTVHAEGKLLSVFWFYRSNDQPDLRERWLKQQGITHVWWSDEERKLGAFNPDQQPYLRLLWRTETAAVYEVR